MKNDITKIFGSDMTEIMEGMVEIFDKTGAVPEDIVNYLAGYGELTRGGIHLVALSKGNKELADKIEKANEIIKLDRINAFKVSVANGTHEEFLGKMSWTDKCSLQVDMGLFRMGFPSETPLTPEEQMYLSIIQSSIDKDILNEALSQGFSSVEAWREHNSRIASQRAFARMPEENFIIDIDDIPMIR